MALDWLLVRVKRAQIAAEVKPKLGVSLLEGMKSAWCRGEIISFIVNCFPELWLKFLRWQMSVALER